jgi:DUF1365 family protein
MLLGNNNGCLVYAKIMHKRFLPVINSFFYRVFYVLLPMKNLSSIKNHFFSYNKFNIFSFFDCDYGNKTSQNPVLWLENILQQNNLQEKVDNIFLLTHLRIFGYAFNPVSFWFCVDKNQQPIVILAEVNNTFGEHHCYLLFNNNHHPITKNQHLSANKHFHVSPFFLTEGKYLFNFTFSPPQISATIDYFLQEKMLATSLHSYKTKEFNSKNSFLALCFMPLMFIKVIVLIHWQAIKIMLKSIKYIKKPQPKKEKITIVD